MSFPGLPGGLLDVDEARCHDSTLGRLAGWLIPQLSHTARKSYVLVAGLTIKQLYVTLLLYQNCVCRVTE